MSLDFDKFLKEVELTMRWDGISIAHQDAHGAFILRPLDESDVRWLRDAERQPDQEAAA